MLWALLALALAAPAPAPAQAELQRPAERQLTLKAGTPVQLSVVREVNSKSHQQGDRFDLVVREAVLVDGSVVIPSGAPAVGEVSRHVAKGAFGKAGELEIQLLHVVVGGRRIRLDGDLERQGKDAVVPAAAVGVVVAGVLGSAIVGKNASIPAGSPFTGYVHRDIAFAMSPN